MRDALVIEKGVGRALDNGDAVVALESTVISHGLPYPDNVETALAMEQSIRDGGAFPATIAVIGGQLKVGLSPDELSGLARAEDVRKCSPRDLPIVCGSRGHGATTVAATIRIAHAAGIPVMATGGIGGVHRGDAMDVSADLLELGRTPVTVVCSGAKAILDISRTVEALETLGVTVAGYQADEFPAFYTATSGLPVDVRCEQPADVAAIIASRDALGLSAAVLVAVPVPAAHGVDPVILDDAIGRAVSEAHDRGIRGRDLTPFLLARVSALTNEDSKIANKALLCNNAGIAASIAIALAASTRG